MLIFMTYELIIATGEIPGFGIGDGCSREVT